MSVANNNQNKTTNLGQVTPTNTITEKLLEYRLKEREKYVRPDPNIIYVTELTKCSLKRVYSMKFQQLLASEVLDSKKFMGNLVHESLERILKEIYKENIKTEAENTRRDKTVEVDGVKYIIRGRIDAILGIDTGIEIKETSNGENIPAEHHIEQVKIYNWLYSFPRTILIYVTPEGIFEFEVTDRYTDADIIQKIKEFKAPRYDWECKYCEFRSVCSVYKLMKRKQEEEEEKQFSYPY